MVSPASESLSLCRSLDDPIGIAFSLICLGRRAQVELNYQQARAMLEEAISLLRTAQHMWGVGFAIIRLGEVLILQGEFARAEVIMEESLVLSRTLDDSLMVVDVLGQLVEAALAQDDFLHAQRLAEQRLTLAQERGQTEILVWSLRDLGHIAMQTGDYGLATSFFEQSTGLWQRMNYGKVRTDLILTDLGLVSRLQGDYEGATQRLNEAAAICREADDNAGLALIQLHLGYTVLAKQDESRALIHFRECVKLSNVGDDKLRLVVGLVAIAEMLQAQGEAQRAVRLCGFVANFQQAVRVAFMPAERAGYDRTIAAARAQLDDPELAEAWAEGQKMTLDEAVELALAAA